MSLVFKDEWLDTLNWITPVKNDKYHAYCKVCRLKVTIRYNGIHSLYNHEAARKHQKNLRKKRPKVTEKSLKSSQSSLNVPSYHHHMVMPRVYEHPLSVSKHCVDENYISHTFVPRIESGDSSESNLKSMHLSAEEMTHEMPNRNNNNYNSQISPQKEAKSKELTIIDISSLNSQMFTDSQSSNPNTLSHLQNYPVETRKAHVSYKFPYYPFQWNVEGNTNRGLCLPSETEHSLVSQKESEPRLQKCAQSDCQTSSEAKIASSSSEIFPNQLFLECSDIEDSRKPLPIVPSCISNVSLKDPSLVTEGLHQKYTEKNAEEKNNYVFNQDKSSSRRMEISEDSSVFSNPSSNHTDDTDSDYYEHLSTLDYCYFASTYSQLKASLFKKVNVQENLNKIFLHTTECLATSNCLPDTENLNAVNHLHEDTTMSKTSSASQLKAQKSIKTIERKTSIFKHSPEMKQNKIITEHQPFPEKSSENAWTSFQNSLEADMFNDTLCLTKEISESLQNSSRDSDHSTPTEINLRNIANQKFSSNTTTTTSPDQSKISQTFTNSANRAPYHRLSDLLENIFKSNDRESNAPCSSNNSQNYPEGADQFPDVASSLASNDNSFNHKIVSQIDFQRGIKYFKNILLKAKLDFDRECTNILQQLENFLTERILLKSREIEDLSFIDSIYDRYLSNRNRMERNFIKSMLLLSSPTSFSSNKDCHQVENSLRDDLCFNECQNNAPNCDPTFTNTDYVDASPEYSAVTKECKKEATNCKRRNVELEIGKTIKCKKRAV